MPPRAANPIHLRPRRQAGSGNCRFLGASPSASHTPYTARNRGSLLGAAHRDAVLFCIEVDFDTPRERSSPVGSPHLFPVTSHPPSELQLMGWTISSTQTSSSSRLNQQHHQVTNMVAASSLPRPRPRSTGRAPGSWPSGVPPAVAPTAGSSPLPATSPSWTTHQAPTSSRSTVWAANCLS